MNADKDNTGETSKDGAGYGREEGICCDELASAVCEDSDNLLWLPDQKELNSITERILGFAFKVHNHHGHGFHEKIYENSLVHEMRKSGLRVDQQYPFCVYYDGVLVGEYKADILIEEKVLFEGKVAEKLIDKHKAQCLNYLKATGLKVCLLVNFGNARLEYKRIVNNF